MNRRSILKALPFAAAGGIATAASSATAPDTPVMRAFRERQAYFAWLDIASKSDALSNDDMEAAVNVLTDMEDAMMLIPSENAQDFIAKVVAYSHDGNSCLPSAGAMPELWAEAKRFAGGVA